MRVKSHKPKKVNIITLGCSKNRVDSEVLMGQLMANNIQVQHEQNGYESEMVIINTCGFIDNAKKESIDTILEYARAKQEGKIEKLIVTGCLSERYKPELEKEIKEVDQYFGTNDLPRLLKFLNADYKHELIGERFLTTPSHYAYMKVSEGCNRGCAFCAIPLMRGKHVSKPIEQLVLEAKNLAKNGTKELILIAQDMSSYGMDIYNEKKLAGLLRVLSDVNGIEWIRMHYVYPAQFPINTLQVIKERKNICKYIDMPVQHINDVVLKKMRRGINKKRTYELIKKIRKEVPNIAIRTTLMIGFPGETKQQFNELISFIKEMQFERLGVFTYSHEENTAAHLFNDDVLQQVKEQRAEELMSVQKEISLKNNKKFIGKIFKVLIDKKEGDYFEGRTEYDSPEVDNTVLIDAKDNYAKQGGFVCAKINTVSEFDLYGEVVSGY